MRLEGERKVNDLVSMKINIDDIILSALKEDITSEDITTNAIVRESARGEAELICKQDGILAGIEIFKRVFKLLDDSAEVGIFFNDGDNINKGDLIAVVKADVRVILSGERTALNYLQRMSGIATYTRAIVTMLEGSKTKLLNTRKTTPNMRIFETYSVRVGGAKNHRFNLSDGILIKDNHINAAGGIMRAVELARDYAPFVRKIEVETEDLDMVREALEAGADIIMLDNMDKATMQEAIKIIDGRAITESSGNISKENIAEIKEIGVDYISSGALTHSAPILDFSLKNLRVTNDEE